MASSNAEAKDRGCDTCGRDPLSVDPLEWVVADATDEQRQEVVDWWRARDGRFVYALPGFPITLCNCMSCYANNAYPEYIVAGMWDEGLAVWFLESVYWDTATATYRKIADYAPTQGT